MLTIEIPGREALSLSHLILDYNGTIALDGEILPGIRERLEVLSQDLQICVITADTHGTAAQKCQGMPLQVLTFPTAEVGRLKAEEVRKRKGGVVAIGNGYNDIGMSQAAELSICVMGTEGCCSSLMAHTDVTVTSILHALDLLLIPGRLRATLRT